MVRLKISIALNYQAAERSTFFFNIQPCSRDGQTVLYESLSIEPFCPVYPYLDAQGNRFLRMQGGPGPITVRTESLVQLEHEVGIAEDLHEHTAATLPSEVLRYVLPSRYCESDKLMSFAMSEFGHLAPGYSRVRAIADWVHREITFRPGTSNWTTSAADLLESRHGVCRDFAHLMIALCRALNIPARFCTGIDYGADPDLGPCDFHAYVEVWLGGRWWLVDPTDISPTTGLVRLGTGIDASDVAFATVFGNVTTNMPLVSVEALYDPIQKVELPVRSHAPVSMRLAGV